MKFEITESPNSYLLLELNKDEKIIIEKGCLIYSDGEYNFENKIDDTEISLPFLGRIAAGNPIEAITNSFEQISVPNYLVNNKNQHFTLEVCGDSMIDEGIFDGDIVVIKKTETAITGDIVVALIDENEVTLKKFRSFKNSIALEPSNKNFKTRIFGEGRVRIQGKLVGLIRKF